MGNCRQYSGQILQGSAEITTKYSQWGSRTSTWKGQKREDVL